MSHFQSRRVTINRKNKQCPWCLTSIHHQGSTNRRLIPSILLYSDRFFFSCHNSECCLTPCFEISCRRQRQLTSVESTGACNIKVCSICTFSSYSREEFTGSVASSHQRLYSFAWCSLNLLTFKTKTFSNCQQSCEFIFCLVLWSWLYFSVVLFY